MRWDDFERACPEIATLARERFLRDDLVLVGTIRSDGSPRISPNEPDFAAERFFVSMMWRSRKALDLLRDPRLVVHSVTARSVRGSRQGLDIRTYVRYNRTFLPRAASLRRHYRRRIEVRDP